MTWKMPNISWFDLGIITLFFIGGWLYLHDFTFWSFSMLGEAPYGDAGFWWEGAVNVAHGIFQDNPGKGYRPGYFLFTGLTLPVLGMQFQQYFIYFLFLFLTVSSLFYLALRHILGNWAAACAVGMLIFNPFTAEWLVTSTTDATGLLLNMGALSCLLLGLNKGLRLGWLSAFGILFSLATLTRPLVTPFIGVVLLILLFIPTIPFKKRLWATLCIIIAFCLPTFSWMTIQKLTIDRWAISSNDASAFYGASHPDIQVWNPTMYEPIQKIAAEYYHTSPDKINDQQLNQIFWLETVKNYKTYANYHLKRLLPHLWEIAKFSPTQSRNPSHFWQILFLCAIGSGLAVWFLLQKAYLRALLLTTLSLGIYLSPTIIPFMVLAGAILALIQPGEKKQWGMFLLSLYWLTGVFALFLIGGTFGKPSFSVYFALNALGYRLGTQVFFVGDLLACYFILRLAYVRWKTNDPQTLIQHPAPLASGLVSGYFGIFFASLMIVYITGSYVVMKRAYALSHDIKKPYPDLDTITRLYKQQTGRNLLQVEGSNGGLSMPSSSSHADILFTGTVSPIIWNMLEQERTKLNIYTQNQLYPYTMGPLKLMLDLPQYLTIKDWNGTQGAFVIREIADKHNSLYSPFHQTGSVIRAFFPLALDGQSYDVKKALWFPLVKNATQLDTSGELSYKNAKVNWVEDLGLKPFQRRFFVVPETTSQKVQLMLNTSTVRGPATLSFSYDCETKQKSCDVEMVTISTKQAKTFSPSEKNIKLSIPEDVKTVQITFNHVSQEDKIWFYEFNLSTVD